MGKLAAGLVHEIRNPLSAIRLNIEYLEMEKDKLDADMLESVHSCQEALERINYLIENVLEFSRRGFNDGETHSLNEVVSSGFKIMHPLADTRSITLQHNFCDDLPNFQFNKNKVLQVIINLVTNAIEASSKGDNIIISTRMESINENLSAILEVKDHGHGIAVEHQDKIFHDFFTNKHKGTGLGLSVCRAIVEEHSGDISFTSTPGEGSTFTVKFPCMVQARKAENQ